MATRSEVRAKSKRSKALGQSMSSFKTAEKARKKFIMKKTSEGSAFGLSDRDNAAKKPSRDAAAKQARQAGGDGRLGLGGIRKLKPKKIGKKK